LVFLSSFVFPLLFRHCFIPVSLAHVVSSLAYPNLLGTKMLGLLFVVVNKCSMCNPRTSDFLIVNEIQLFLPHMNM
jgi:hypothetical protein